MILHRTGALLVSNKSIKQQDGFPTVRAIFNQDFAKRCVPFDEVAATHYAQIVATALANRMVLATRNVGDYEHIDGLIICNP